MSDEEQQMNDELDQMLFQQEMELQEQYEMLVSEKNNNNIVGDKNVSFLPIWQMASKR